MQQHQAESPWTYTYDNAGNQTVEDAGGAVTTNAYDPENRLTVVAHPDGTLSTYAYQGYDGLRRSKHEPGGALATFVWDGSVYLQERS
jgi:YD repeat-containing protein